MSSNLFDARPIPSGGGCLAQRQALKEQFLSGLAAVSRDAGQLRATVGALVKRGVSKSLMLAWAVSAGYSEGYAATVLNRILRQETGAKRKSGAGPKTPPEALALLALVLERHGEQGIRFLLAAYRAGKARAASKAGASAVFLQTVQREPARPSQGRRLNLSQVSEWTGQAEVASESARTAA